MTTMERERVELVHQAMVVLAWTHRNWPKGMVRYEAEGLVSSGVVRSSGPSSLKSSARSAA